MQPAKNLLHAQQRVDVKQGQQAQNDEAIAPFRPGPCKHETSAPTRTAISNHPMMVDGHINCIWVEQIGKMDRSPCQYAGDNSRQPGWKIGGAESPRADVMAMAAK